MPGDLLSGALIEVARDLREKRVTARELVEAAIARHERFGERLHAYSLWAPEQARAVAAAADAAFSAGVTVGPPQGLPISIKDLFAAAGYPCFAGSSGAGVSLLECSALLAFGSDTAGSVRIPGVHDRHGRPEGHTRPLAGRWRRRCPRPSTRRTCRPAASATSHTALPRWTPPASIRPASSREQAPATSLGFASASATRSCG